MHMYIRFLNIMTFSHFEIQKLIKKNFKEYEVVIKVYIYAYVHMIPKYHDKFHSLRILLNND